MLIFLKTVLKLWKVFKNAPMVKSYLTKLAKWKCLTLLKQYSSTVGFPRYQVIWLVVSVYKPLATHFLYWLSQIIEFYSIIYEKQSIIRYYNLTPDNKSMRECMDLYYLMILIKTTTCFKGTVSCIDLSLIN